MIIHLDGDGFFAACEIALNPKLKGKPVVTGQERGIASAMSPEAKLLGITRGMPIFKIRELYPEVVTVSSNYMHYGIFAQRAYNIVRRYTDEVEEYSIDECFAELDDVEAAKRLKYELRRDLGVIFSVGMAPTKVLAKVASKWNKPDGFAVIRRSDIHEYLKTLDIGKVWGIGPATSQAMRRLGIETSLDLIERPERWVASHFSRPVVDIWHELRGEPVYGLHTNPTLDEQKSIQQTRTFSKTFEKKVILSELSKNVEGACQKARSMNLYAKRIYYFLKTQEFRYHRFELPLAMPTNVPTDILAHISSTIDLIYKKGIEYRATGVTLAELTPSEGLQNDLFGEVVKNEKKKKIFETVDQIDGKYGTHTVVLASSISAYKRRGARPEKHLKIPCMGEVA